MDAGWVGKYRLEHELGTGAHGRVIKAVDSVLDRSVALKSLKKSSVGHKALVKEAKTLANLSHANIVTLYELVEYDNDAFLVMEYVDGAPLSARLKSGPFPINEAIQIVEQLADALAHASDAGIIHGDIKPGNIMLACDGAPRLVDFGLAKFSSLGDALATLTQSSDSNSSLEGTLPYMAPEAVMGDSIDSRADIFALGAVFYEMIAGVRAFDAKSQGAVLNQILNDSPTPLKTLRPDTPQWVEDLIAEMLEKKPDLRPQSMAAVRGHLAMRGKRDWRAVAQNFGRRAHRLAMRKRSPPQWLKIVAVTSTAAVAVWAGLIVTRDIAPPVSVRMNEGLERVHHFERKGAVNEAKELFSSILADDPGHAGATAGLALALIREYTSMETDAATLRRAITLAKRAYEEDPHLSLAVIAAAWAAEFDADFIEAHRLYDISDMLDPNNPLILEGKARTLKLAGDYDSAISIFEKAIMLYPTERVFYDDLGDTLIRKGYYAEAERIFRESIKIDSDSVFGYANLAQSLHLQGETSEAITIVQNGLKVRKSPALYNNLGTYLFFQGEYAQAARAFERTLEFEGNSHDYIYWANLADSYRWTPGRSKQALRAYKRALQLLGADIEKYGNHPGLSSRAALYHAKAGNFEDASAALAMLNRSDALRPIQLYRASVTLEILGEREAALKMLASAIEGGYAVNEVENNPELSALRQDTAYHLILAQQGMDNG